MKLKLLRSSAAVATLAFSLCSGNAWGAQGSAMSPMNTSHNGPAKPSAAAKTMPSDAAITDAKSKGLVWVNLNTKVYHKDDAVYGKTKNGQFMTEADAQKMGARLAKTSPAGKKKSQ